MGNREANPRRISVGTDGGKVIDANHLIVNETGGPSPAPMESWAGSFTQVDLPEKPTTIQHILTRFMQPRGIKVAALEYMQPEVTPVFNDKIGDVAEERGKGGVAGLVKLFFDHAGKEDSTPALINEVLAREKGPKLGRQLSDYISGHINWLCCDPDGSGSMPSGLQSYGLDGEGYGGVYGQIVEGIRYNSPGWYPGAPEVPKMDVRVNEFNIILAPDRAVFFETMHHAVKTADRPSLKPSIMGVRFVLANIGNNSRATGKRLGVPEEVKKEGGLWSWRTHGPQEIPENLVKAADRLEILFPKTT